VPALATSTSLPEIERTRGLALANTLSIPWLGRLWQMLLKGVAEVEAAPDRRAAAEMILIRLCHVADMPPPADLIKKLSEPGATPTASYTTTPPDGGGARAVANGGTITSAAPRALTFQDVVALAGTKRDAMLYAHLRQSAHLVRFAPPVIELRLEPAAPKDLLPRLAAMLEAETSRRWTIVLSHEQGEPTLDSIETAVAAAAQETARDHPLVHAILAAFPGARVEAKRVEVDAAPEIPADWAAFAPPDETYEEGEPEL